jgi:hypothetical protein
LRNRYDTQYKERTLHRETKAADTATHPLH